MGFVGDKDTPSSVAELAALGVRRISLGGGLSRAALGAFYRAARELRDKGTFTFAQQSMPFAEANAFMVGE